VTQATVDLITHSAFSFNGAPQANHKNEACSLTLSDEDTKRPEFRLQFHPHNAIVAHIDNIKKSIVPGDTVRMAQANSSIPVTFAEDRGDFAAVRIDSTNRTVLVVSDVNVVGVVDAKMFGRAELSLQPGTVNEASNTCSSRCMNRTIRPDNSQRMSATFENPDVLL
jgi:hypothetical protein